MRRALFVVLLGGWVAAPAAAQTPAPPGQPPPPPANEQPDRITVTPVFKTIVFGEPSFISGRFRHLDNPDAEPVGYRGKTLTVEEAPFPFAAFTQIGSVVTDREGYFSMKVTPGLNSRYRVRSADPPVDSATPIIRVRLKVSLDISDLTPRRRQKITISGEASPPRDGKSVLIECRRPGRGAFRLVARARLKDDGDVRSLYSKRLTVKNDCDFRVRLNGDAQNLPGVSGRAQEVRVSG
jgi:hypothetical protein